MSTVMESAMSIVADHSKVKLVEYESLIRSIPQIEGIEFYLAFIRPTLALVESWIEGERCFGILRSLAEASWLITRRVEKSSNFQAGALTRSYILADVLNHLDRLREHFGYHHEILPEIDAALLATHTCLGKLFSHGKDATIVSDELFDLSTDLRDTLDDLANRQNQFYDTSMAAELAHTGIHLAQ